jgi:hypothetical protein
MLWVITIVASLFATTRAMSGSHSPLESLITSAPAAIARAATAAEEVSTEMTTVDAASTASTTGTTRSHSSSTDTAGPRPNGTPPMSTQSAPSSSARRHAATARSSAKVEPLS